MKMPLAMPSTPPRALAPTEMQKSAGTDVASMSVALRRALRNAPPGEARLEPDGVAAIVQSFVVDRAMFGGIRGPLDQEDRAANRDLERHRDSGLSRGGLQHIFGLDQRRVVALLQRA